VNTGRKIQWQFHNNQLCRLYGFVRFFSGGFKYKKLTLVAPVNEEAG